MQTTSTLNSSGGDVSLNVAIITVIVFKERQFEVCGNGWFVSK